MSILILIVEDEPDQSESLKDILEDEGYRVEVAATGEEALKAVAMECPAVVLMDFSLPDMDGREFVRRTRESCADAPPFILTTGVHPSKVAGVADVVLYKPLEIDKLLAAVRRLCSGVRSEKGKSAGANDRSPSLGADTGPPRRSPPSG